MSPEEEFKEWYEEYRKGPLYSSSGHGADKHAAFMAGRNAGLEAAAMLFPVYEHSNPTAELIRALKTESAALQADKGGG